ncbi:MAG TPA: M48 family metallopeptidase [Candidatus Acidoferrum sp.]|jgi:Zn-dependent protease with chaperone function|nr:M48 family metallopeptidase [Candidatus Acidoferrum sp.]
MRRTAFNFLFTLLIVTLFARTLHAAQQPRLNSPAASAQRQMQNSGAPSSPAVSPLQTEAPRKITAYTLPPDLYRKAHTRGRILFSLRLFSFFYTLFILWFILNHQLSAKYREWAEKFSYKHFLQALLFTPLLVLTVGVIRLPLTVLREWIEKSYGISVQPWGSWIGDWAKAQLLVVLIGIPLVWILYSVIHKSPRRWWLYFWLASLPILFLIVFISPYVVEPMFNKFEPLTSKAPELVPRLQNVTRRAGQEIPPERMFWMKASDKTISTNAYVSGFGASKRIVIWDTAIAQETPDEVVTDFGHEMGHYVLGHVWKGIILGAILLFVLLYLGYRSIGWVLARWGAGWGVRGLDDFASLPALLLLITIFAFLANPITSAFSRFEENQADIYSLEVTHGILPDPGQASAHEMQLWGETVFDDPDPNPIDVLLFYDHPTTANRIHLFVTYDPWSKGEQPQFVK